jgi:Ca2+-binding EF-hand superfamily protein
MHHLLFSAALLLCFLGRLHAEGGLSDFDVEHDQLGEPDSEFDAGLHSHHEPIDEADRPKMLEKMQKIVDALDKDGDGRLSMHEIKSHVSAGVRAQMDTEEKRMIAEGKQEMDGMFEKKDLDNDGYISKDEMFKEHSAKDFVESEFLRHQDDTFDLADRNKDNKLDKEEMLIFLHPHISGDHNPHAEEYKKMITDQSFVENDHDKDGKVSWAEHWKQVRGEHEFSGDQLEELHDHEQKLFDEADVTPTDGNLSPEEFHALNFPNVAEMDLSGPQTANMHAMVDADQDGHLTWEEMTQDHALNILTSGLDHGGKDEL